MLPSHCLSLEPSFLLVFQHITSPHSPLPESSWRAGDSWKHCILGLISFRMYGTTITHSPTGVNPRSAHVKTYGHMDIKRHILSTHIHSGICMYMCVLKSMTQPCKHQLLSGLYALLKPQLGDHVKQKRPLGPTGVGYLPSESITQGQIDSE